MSQSAPPSTSTSLLDQVKLRNEEAWRALAQIYGPTVYRWCRRAGLQPADAADVVQEVFQAVSVHIDRFRRDRAGDSFRAWLWTIYRSKLMDHFRQRKVEPAAPGGSAANAVVEALVHGAEEPVSGNEDSEETSRLVCRALMVIQDDFQERTWQAFWRCAVLGERTGDVASTLGMTAAAVCMSRSRVLRRLREALAGLGVCPDEETRRKPGDAG